MNKKIIIESLAMDLKRVAVGLNRGSLGMALRFKQEALKRSQELENEDLEPYLVKILSKTKLILSSESERVAEDALMYSTLFQNFAQKIST